MTLVVAHRGASAHAPENTLDAFRQAVEMGADAIELDVHVTRDGELAVIHDETLERTTDLEGRVSDLTMKQIRRADAGYRFAAADGSFPFRAKGLKVPTLREVLGWLPAGTGLVVEIKASVPGLSSRLAVTTGTSRKTHPCSPSTVRVAASSSVVKAIDPTWPAVAPAAPLMLMPRSATASDSIARLPGRFGNSTMNALISTSPDRRDPRCRARCPARSPGDRIVRVYRRL
jgi:hypothetical protein